MLLQDLDYPLPPQLIAQEPADPRDSSRLLVCRRSRGSASVASRDAAARLEDRGFRDLPDLLRPGDLLVRNDTRVLAARTQFRRPSGGRLELLFLHSVDRRTRLAERGTATGIGCADDDLDAPPAGDGGEVWEVLVRGRPRVGELLGSAADEAWSVRVLHGYGDGRWLVENTGHEPVAARLSRSGEAPLPPYIRRRLADPERYQTTYARRTGSAAAPTAGLHFTAELDQRLATAGVRIATVTLHVGLGTFKPLADDVVAANRLHAETFAVAAAVWSEILRARGEGRRVVAVGTTTVRTLEHLARSPQADGADDVLRGNTELFITPGFSFRVVDALVTNFHLPRTSLLALVMALLGVAETRAAYEHAVREKYRFYSFGDAMLIL